MLVYWLAIVCFITNFTHFTCTKLYGHRHYDQTIFANDKFVYVIQLQQSTLPVEENARVVSYHGNKYTQVFFSNVKSIKIFFQENPLKYSMMKKFQKKKRMRLFNSNDMIIWNISMHQYKWRRNAIEKNAHTHTHSKCTSRVYKNPHFEHAISLQIYKDQFNRLCDLLVSVLTFNEQRRLRSQYTFPLTFKIIVV